MTKRNELDRPIDFKPAGGAPGPYSNSYIEHPEEFGCLTMTYMQAMHKIAEIFKREITNHFDRASQHPDVAALFYKGVIHQLVRCAVKSVGEKKARSILRQVSEEIISIK